MAHYDAYIICTSPRSGSTLLCNLLAGTHVAGNPASYFHRPSVSAWLQQFNLPENDRAPERERLQTILTRTIAAGSLDTGLFGLRLQQPSLDFFRQKLAVLCPESATDVQRLYTVFGRTAFLHLTRVDKVSQAVSHVKADQTGLWHRAADGSELERQSPPQTPHYDPESIQRRLEEARVCDQAWVTWFAEENINPFRILYEDLCADPKAILKQILAFLGLDAEAANGVEPGIARLADATSLDWVSRFKAQASFLP